MTGTRTQTGTRTPRGRTIALVAAVGVVAVAAVAAVAGRKYLATQYYVWRLQSDASRFELLIDSPSLSVPQEEALRQYCQTTDGGSALFKNLFRTFPGVDAGAIDVFDMFDMAAAFDTEASIDIGIDSSGDYWLRMRAANRFNEGQSSTSTDRDRARLRRLHDLLRLIDGREFVVEQYPSLKFKVEWHELGSKEPVVRAVGAETTDAQQ